MLKYALTGLMALQVVAVAASASSPSPSSAPSAANSEVAVLRAQLETTKQFQDSFMSMAQWTLGSSIAVALAMGIFAWHTNRRNYDRDRESIHREAEALATELRAELQLESQAEMKRIADSLADREQSIRETIERAFAPKLASVGARIDRVEEEALSLRHDALEREAEEALASGRYARAIERYCSLLNIQVKRDMDKYLTGYVLDKLREIAKSPKAILDAETVTLVAKTLAELPTRHHAACEPLVALFKGKLA